MGRGKIPRDWEKSRRKVEGGMDGGLGVERCEDGE